MRVLSTPLVVSGVALALLLFGVALFRSSPAARTAREIDDRKQGGVALSSGVAPLPTITIDAALVEPRKARIRVELSGILEPRREVLVSAEVAGRVVALEAVEHGAVAEGEVLVRLDPALPEVAVERARASLQRAEARLALAAAEARRQRELSARGVASAAALERAESEDRSAAAAVAEARATLLDAETRLAKTRIRAPFSGVVSELDLEPGAYLRPGDPVARVADLAELEIEVGVSDRQILAIRDGQDVAVEVEALPGQWFEGRVTRPGRTADSRTRKYPVPVRVSNEEGRLLGGMLATVRFELGNGLPVVWVPRRAVVREFDLEYLYVMEDTEQPRVARAHRRRVRTRPVAFHPELLEVEEGLEVGERVALSGLGELREGLRVRLREADQDLREEGSSSPERASPVGPTP